MSEAPKLLSNHAQRLVINGELDSVKFLPWVIRHCGRLGLSFRQIHASSTQAIFQVEGQPDLIDALEVGCLLGPIDVWVDTIERQPARVTD